MKLIILNLLAISIQLTVPSTSCLCSQLFNQQDCLAINCEWTNQTCAINSGTSTSTTYKSYCNYYDKDICPQKTCAYQNNSCTFFAGCTAYLETTILLCNSINNQCTSDGFHCIPYTDCTSYKTEIGCQSGDQIQRQCVWDGTNCSLPTTCSQLSNTYTTDQQCRTQISTCTMNVGGGCIQSGDNCENQTLESQCYWNKLKTQSCYWIDNKCISRICSNASTTLQTDSQCINYLSICTTKSGGGCINRTSCQDVKIQQACITNSNNEECYWDGIQCFDKKCTSAPNTYNTNDKCKNINTSCITNGNGCITQTNCGSSTLEIGCIDLPNGSKCIWNNNKCEEKTCSNSCDTTVCIQLSNGCVSKTCNNIQDDNTCRSLNSCIWLSNCFTKQCSLASYSYTSISECQNYLSSCTLDNSGYGCMQIPINCNAYTSKVACSQIQSNNGSLVTISYCGWDGTKCIARQCQMADTTYNTSLDCQLFLQNCVVSNTGIGCMDLPLKCSDRKLQDNCVYDLCVWNGTICLDKSCETAQYDGISVFNTSTCNQYGSNCIPNNQLTSCMNIPDSCTSLSQLNCNISNSSICILSNGACKDKICSNIYLTSHNLCHTELQNCTVNPNGIQCLDIQQKCLTYNSQTNCYLSKQGNCFWTGVSCRNALCSDSTDTVNYQTDSNCQTLSSQCTVISRISQNGCIDRLSNCSDYKYQYQCYQTINQVKCLWFNNACYAKSLFTCDNIVLATYSDANCQAELSFCKANPGLIQCISKICEDYSYTSLSDCQNISNITGCTINVASTQCIKKLETCAEYSADLTTCSYSKEGKCINNGSTCYYKYKACSGFTDATMSDSFCTTQRPFCTFITGTTCSNRACTSKVGTGLTYQDCQDYDLTCVPSTDGTSCQSILTACTNGTSTNCSKSNIESCVYDTNTNACVSLANAVVKNCHLITLTSYSWNNCQSQSPYCGVNRTNTKCTNLSSSCTSYTILDCYKSTGGRCIQNQQSDTNASCLSISATIPCNQFYLGQFYVYTETDCSSLRQSCTNDGTTGCKDKLCTYATSLITHKACQAYLNTCTVSSTGCVTMPLTCESQLIDCLHSKEGECFIQSGKCLLKKCLLASTSFNTDSQCSAFSTKCTVANIGGCIDRKTDCASYTTDIQCKYNSLGQKCLWNSKGCFDWSCQSVELNTYNFNLCNQFDNSCTVNSLQTGCTSLTNCSTYTSQSQCIIDDQQIQCIWNVNVNPNVCTYKSCSTADLTFTTHAQCFSYDENCTLNSSGIGCQNQGECSSYLQLNCIISNQGDQCGWDGSNCIIKNCTTAGIELTTHNDCQIYNSKCTVQSTGQGCINIPNTCEQLTNEIQCFINSTGDLCTYQNGSCKTKTCDNPPSDIDTQSECEQWIPNVCTAEDTNKCKNITCETYIYVTDNECKNKMSTCTTDGKKCVQRGKCEEAYAQAGCTLSNDGIQCYWNGQICQDKLCSIITSQADCNQQYDQTKCIWDTSQENQFCRIIGQCSDYPGTNCPSNCKVSYEKQCVPLTQCKDYIDQPNCIYGTDGPCLWVNEQCYSAQNCNSFQWTTDQECKQISKLCTTNGTTCIPLTFCNETNVTGGCITGIDGDCLLTVPSLGSNQTPVCKLLTSCIDAYYITHSECQNANKQCTTNGVTSCMKLEDCTQYIQQNSCVIDILGQQKDNNNQITSTGICIWDQQKCRHQKCNDLIGITHQECNIQLSTCTSDGSTCMTQSDCNSYTSETICNVAYSQTGKCQWSQNYCILLSCSGIENGTTLQNCLSNLSTCVSDGNNCILQGVCSSYLTQTACNSGGTDGICVWNGTICITMNSCTSADNDAYACAIAQDRCAFTGKSCTTHTCSSYLGTNGLCKWFYNWNKTSKTLCKMSESGKCEQIEPTSLSQNDCLVQSQYTYTWNTSTNKCISCSTQKTNDTNNNNSTDKNNSSPTTSVDYQLILVLSVLNLFNF